MVKTHCLNNPFKPYAQLSVCSAACYLCIFTMIFVYSISTRPDSGPASKNFLYNSTILCQSLTRLCQVGCGYLKYVHARLHAWTLLVKQGVNWSNKRNILSKISSPPTLFNLAAFYFLGSPFWYFVGQSRETDVYIKGVQEIWLQWGHLFHSLIMPFCTYAVSEWGCASYSTYLCRIDKLQDGAVKFGYLILYFWIVTIHNFRIFVIVIKNVYVLTNEVL